MGNEVKALCDHSFESPEHHEAILVMVRFYDSILNLKIYNLILK